MEKRLSFTFSTTTNLRLGNIQSAERKCKTCIAQKWPGHQKISWNRNSKNDGAKEYERETKTRHGWAGVHWGASGVLGTPPVRSLGAGWPTKTVGRQEIAALG